MILHLPCEIMPPIMPTPTRSSIAAGRRRSADCRHRRLGGAVKFPRALWVVLVVVLAACSAGGPDLQVEDAWVRAAPPDATAMAGYMVVHNRTSADRALSGARSPDFGAVEIHRTVVENGVARMEPAEHAVVPAVGELTLAPGGMHLMLMRPAHALAPGDTVTLILSFDDGSTVEVRAPVQRR